MEGRAEYRIVYPILARPIVTMDGFRFVVLNCSERGIRISQRALPEAPVPGSVVSGELALAQGEVRTFSGRLLRLDPDSWVIELDAESRIPLPLIYQEQRYLRSRFPDWR
jgi:hypothetical protein